MAAATRVERVRSIEINEEDRGVCIKLKSNGDTVCIHMSIRAYEAGLAMGNEALARHRAKSKVVPIRGH